MHKRITDEFFLFSIPITKAYDYHTLNHLVVTKENKSYKAVSRSRDYMVHCAQYTLHLKYDDYKLITLLTINDPDSFMRLLEKFAQDLHLSVHHE